MSPARPLSRLIFIFVFLSIGLPACGGCGKGAGGAQDGATEQASADRGAERFDARSDLAAVDATADGNTDEPSVGWRVVETLDVEPPLFSTSVMNAFSYGDGEFAVMRDSFFTRLSDEGAVLSDEQLPYVVKWGEMARAPDGTYGFYVREAPMGNDRSRAQFVRTKADASLDFARAADLGLAGGKAHVAWSSGAFTVLADVVPLDQDGKGANWSELWLWRFSSAGATVLPKTFLEHIDGIVAVPMYASKWLGEGLTVLRPDTANMLFLRTYDLTGKPPKDIRLGDHADGYGGHMVSLADRDIVAWNPPSIGGMSLNVVWPDGTTLKAPARAGTATGYGSGLAWDGDKAVVSWADTKKPGITLAAFDKDGTPIFTRLPVPLPAHFSMSSGVVLWTGKDFALFYLGHACDSCPYRLQLIRFNLERLPPSDGGAD